MDVQVRLCAHVRLTLMRSSNMAVHPRFQTEGHKHKQDLLAQLKSRWNIVFTRPLEIKPKRKRGSIFAALITSANLFAWTRFYVNLRQINLHHSWGAFVNSMFTSVYFDFCWWQFDWASDKVTLLPLFPSAVCVCERARTRACMRVLIADHQRALCFLHHAALAEEKKNNSGLMTWSVTPAIWWLMTRFITMAIRWK